MYTGAHGNDALEVASLLANLQRGLFGRSDNRRAYVGRYALLGRIGLGGVGVVYSAYDPELDRRVAIKLLSRGRTEDARWKARLAHEAQAMARIDHPNVVRVYDVGTFGEADGEATGVFIVMELVEGETLSRWVQRRPAWREVLAVFAQAGRGLIAAHACGLIHRDFKLGNVVVGGDGRVRVLDFGLARASQETSNPARSPAGAPSIMGTPLYMAPEQHRGDAVDHRADQYAFCVALCWALCGTWPFQGTSPEELARAKEAGPSVSPQRVDVPRRVFAAIERGLSPRPQDRFGTLAELLTALDVASRKRWRARAPVVATVAGALVLATGAAYAADSTPACSSASPLPWAPAGRGQLERAFAGTDGIDPDFARAAAGRVGQVLDAYAERVAVAGRAVCEEGKRRPDADVLADQRWCLDTRVAELAALVDVLAQPDASTIRNAASAAQQLGDPQRCRDQAYASRLLAGTETPQGREDLGQFRAAAAAVEKSYDAGQYAQAHRRAVALLEQAGGLGRRRLVAEAQYLRALTLAPAGVDEQRAADELESAALLLRATRQPVLEFRAWTQLARVLGDSAADIDAAKRALRHAEAAAHAGDQAAREQAALWTTRGMVHSAAGEYAEAEAAHREALALAEAMGSADDGIASTLNALSTALRRQGRFDEAVRVQQRALSLAESALGRSHPDLAVFYGNMATAYNAMDLPKVALPHQERCVELFATALGEGNPRLLAALNNLAAIHYALGQLERAQEVWRDVLEGLGARGRLPTRGNVLNNLGVVAKDLGRTQEALGWQQRALTVKLRAFGREHPSLVSTYNNLGEALVELGRAGEAAELFEQGRVLSSRVMGPDHPKTRELADAAAAARTPRPLR